MDLNGEDRISSSIPNIERFRMQKCTRGFTFLRKYIILGIISLFLLTSCTKIDDNKVASDFPKVTKPYHSDQAMKNGDVVNIHGKYFNYDKWQAFLNNLVSKTNSKVRITSYTIEGDPIFYELTYDGTLIHYTFDNSMDKFSSDVGRQSTSCERVDTKKTEDGREGFVLIDCNNTNTGNTFWFKGNQDSSTKTN